MLAEFSVFPLDKGGSGLSRYVAQSITIIEESGLDFEVHALGTLIEGPAEKVWEVVRRCHENLAEQCGRVVTNLKIDDRRGATGTLTAKVASVEAKLGHKVPKGDD